MKRFDEILTEAKSNIIIQGTNWFGETGELLFTVNYIGRFSLSVDIKKKKVGIWVPKNKKQIHKMISCPNDIRLAIIDFCQRNELNQQTSIYPVESDFNGINISPYLNKVYEKYLKR